MYVYTLDVLGVSFFTLHVFNTQRASILEFIKRYQTNPYDAMLVQDECENVDYVYTE